MNDQYNSQTTPNHSLFENNQQPPPPVTLFEEPPQSGGTTGHTQQAMPPVYQRKPFPVFHISVLALILGVGGWFWFSGKLSMDASEDSNKGSPTDSPYLSETQSFDYPAGIEESFSASGKADLVLAPEAPVAPQVVVNPETDEDPATKLFGVVSRIRSSRTNP